MAIKETILCSCGNPNCHSRVELDYDSETKTIEMKGYDSDQLWFTHFLELNYTTGNQLIKYIRQFYKSDKTKA